MKTAVFRWRLAADKKTKLEAAARMEGVSLSGLLDRITGDWLGQRRGARSTDAAEQAAIRKRALAAVGSVRGGDPTRAERAGELVREIIYKKHVKESNALARRFGRRTDRQP